MQDEESLEEITRLLDSGAPTTAPIVVGTKSWDENALSLAAYLGREDVVLLLLDRGADINLVGGEYGTALAAAVLRGGMDLVFLLLNRGADINLGGGENGPRWTALAAAAYKDSTTVSLLLDRGADIDLVGGEYGTALVTAAFFGSKDNISLLLDRGADINLEGGEYGTALTTAAFFGRTEVLSLLLDRGANINLVGGKFGTALTTATFQKHLNAMLLLLDRGADPNVVGGRCGTALAVAWSPDAVSLLLKRGADVNLVVGGEYGTALAAAAFLGYTDNMSLMLDRGADINLVGGEYGTALGHAIYEGSTKTAYRLLQHGADIMHVGGRYPTALGVYPSALDAAYSEGSSVDPTLLARLQTVTSEVTNVISRPPFPMPYSALCANHHKETPSPSPGSDISSIHFRAGGNITPEQANVPCTELSEEVLWHSLAALVGLHEDTIQAKHQWIRNDVRYFVACNYDFGLAYAAARIAWKHFNDHSLDSSVISIQRGQWHKNAQVLDEARSKAIDTSSSGRVGQQLIILPYSIMPRRIWDLKSNRVVNFRMLHAAQSRTQTTPIFWAVSHSWTSDMSPTRSAINQYQWPVPLPKDISLEYLRSELLALGAEYIWIDVLCLRQQGEVGFEQLRKEEWKLDVPTIGNIYRAAANIVRYFNGLGVRFSNSGWDNPRHWLLRAWTLQEIAAEKTTINAGIPRNRGNIILNSKGKVSGKVVKLRDAIRPVLQLAAQVDSLHGCDVYDLAREMARRHATQPLDKLSGLFYLLRTTKLPCYDEKLTTEDVWRQCFHLLPGPRNIEILHNFPYRGSDEQWFPTWAQMLDWPERDLQCEHMPFQHLEGLVTMSGEASFFIRNIWTVPDAVITETDTPGEYEVEISDLLIGFYLPYLLQEPIDLQDHPVFTLAIADIEHAHNWVVCRAIDKRQWVGTEADRLNLRQVGEFTVLKKVGIMRTDSCSELLVGGEHGAPLLQKADCLFV